MPTPRTPESIGPVQSLKIRTAAFFCAKAFGEFQLIAVHAGDWKLAYYHSQSRLELFNWANDLSETQNRIETERGKARELADALAGWLRQTKAQMPADRKSGATIGLPSL